MLLKKEAIRRVEGCVLGGLCLAVALTLFGAYRYRVEQVSAQVRGDTLRLHIQANSDTPQDQWIKMQVRDAVLQQTDTLFAHSADQAQCLALAWVALPLLQRTAERTLAGLHVGYSARVRLVNMYFDRTRYDTFTLPAGRYDAVRVELGRAQGHNWFCVLYPALCLPAAQAAYPEQEENALVRGEYEWRFALLDWWESLYS